MKGCEESGRRSSAFINSVTNFIRQMSSTRRLLSQSALSKTRPKLPRLALLVGHSIKLGRIHAGEVSVFVRETCQKREKFHEFLFLSCGTVLMTAVYKVNEMEQQEYTIFCVAA